MSRPRKFRRVCCLPGNRSFGPLGRNGQVGKPVSMTVDEYETIRLIDLEGLSQEACARSMGVARTTVQAIYAVAREKLARCLVEGMELSIDGGDYVLCKGNDPGCGCGHRRCRGGRYYVNESEGENL